MTDTDGVVDRPRAGWRPSERLIDALAVPWRPARWRDRYTADVLALIERKAKGEKIEPPVHEEPEAPDDLAAALEASLHGGRRRRASGRRAARRKARR